MRPCSTSRRNLALEIALANWPCSRKNSGPPGQWPWSRRRFWPCSARSLSRCWNATGALGGRFSLNFREWWYGVRASCWQTSRICRRYEKRSRTRHFNLGRDHRGHVSDPLFVRAGPLAGGAGAAGAGGLLLSAAVSAGLGSGGVKTPNSRQGCHRASVPGDGSWSDFAFIPGNDASGGLEGGDDPLCARGAGFSGKDRGTVGGETADGEKVGPGAEHPNESGRGGWAVCGQLPGPAAIADGPLGAFAPAGALSGLLHIAGWESVQETHDPQRAQRVFREDTAVV